MQRITSQPFIPFPEDTKTIIVSKQFKEEIKYDDIVIIPQKEPQEYFLRFTKIDQLRAQNKAPIEQLIKVYSNIDNTAQNPDQKLQYYACRSGNFLGAFWMAYNKHGTITFSADDVWIQILKGFSVHINKNAEKLRDKIVDFQGKQLCEVEIADLDFNLEQALNAFEKAIEQKTKPGVSKIFKANFSTTGMVENFIQQIAVMETFQKFFKYSCWGGCGIQKVSLLGKLEDWLLLKEKLKELKQFDCQWWIQELEPVIDEFINTYNNNVNYDFWDQIFTYQGAIESGKPASIGGWFMAFYPYLYNSRYPNKWFSDKSIKIPIFDFSDNIFSVPILFSVPGGPINQEYVLLAGFSGIYEQNNNYRPQLSAAFGTAEHKKKI